MPPEYLAASVGTKIVQVVAVQLHVNNPVLEVSTKTGVEWVPHEFSYSEYIFKSNNTFVVPPEPFKDLGITCVRRWSLAPEFITIGLISHNVYALHPKQPDEDYIYVPTA